MLENLETLYAAFDEGALPFPLPQFVRKELDGYLDCGLPVRGFAHVQCEHCETSHLVAFSCKGRGFCPSCKGRRMAETAANLIEYVLPPAPLRQWVLTLPHAWRRRVAYDGALLGLLTRIFVKTVLAFYRKRIHRKGESGAVIVVQRTSTSHGADVFAKTSAPRVVGNILRREIVRATRRLHAARADARWRDGYERP